MTAAQYVAAGIGLLVLLGPFIWAYVGDLAERLIAGKVSPDPAALSGPSFEQAVSHLSHVRMRLLRTGLLSDAEKKAIDVLTLALVSGSDE